MTKAFKKIEFKTIKNGEIFTPEFNPFKNNNIIEFSARKEIVVIYGPNGTGKTSLIKVLKGDPNTKLEFSYDGKEYQEGSKVFHVISDQNNRNIIAGDASDFFLGENIRHEYELQKQIAEEREAVIAAIISRLKDFGIDKVKSALIDLVTKKELKDFIRDCANSKSKGKKYADEELVPLLTLLEIHDVPSYTPEKLDFVQKDWNDKNSIIKQIEELVNTRIVPNVHVREIEENTKAIEILSYFKKDKCIVCDNKDFHREDLLAAKTNHKKATLEALDEKVKQAIEQTISHFTTNKSDLFGIKECLLEAIEIGSVNVIMKLSKELTKYKEIYGFLLENAIVDIVSKTKLVELYTKYQSIIAKQPDITVEEFLYIKEIISNSMSKPLEVTRDKNKRLRISLSNQDFLGKERKELPLSTGEQNFLSLMFELLKAKNNEYPIVAIDDPISSFDSIYKNKVAFAIVKMLEQKESTKQKKCIVFTHNTDLIRLLYGQFPHCFNLYLLNNTEGEDNGFIPLENNEVDMLINLEKLLTAFKEKVPKHIKDQELFLLSMIPFMRGYANIIGNKKLFESLTDVMHGYKNKKVDIGEAYRILFLGKSKSLPQSYETSVTDIITKVGEFSPKDDNVRLLDPKKYPLLDRTLRHSLIYLYLRLIVEKKLVEKNPQIDVSKKNQLGQIISAAFPGNSDENVKKRVFLTSKKTLLNEFNHFEGNLSIFQPAIDITDTALEKERVAILDFIDSL